MFVFFYLLFCSLFGVQAKPTGSYRFKRHEYLHSRIHSLHLPQDMKMNDWSDSRLEEGLLHKNTDLSREYSTEEDVQIRQDELSDPY